jgi:hypothetical protein
MNLLFSEVSLRNVGIVVTSPYQQKTTLKISLQEEHSQFCELQIAEGYRFKGNMQHGKRNNKRMQNLF